MLEFRFASRPDFKFLECFHLVLVHTLISDSFNVCVMLDFRVASRPNFKFLECFHLVLVHTLISDSFNV
jgi:hypothetical protein